MEKEPEILDISESDKKLLPVIPLRGFVMFPHMVLSFELSREKSISAAEFAMQNNQEVFIVAQKDIAVESPSSEDLYKIGILANIKQIIHQQGGALVRVLADGVSRAEAMEYTAKEKYLQAHIQTYEDIEYDSNTVTALIRKIRELFEKYLNFIPKVPPDIVISSKSIDKLGELSDYIASNFPFPAKEKQKILETLDIEDRAKILLDTLVSEIDIAQVEEKIAIKLKENIDKNQQDYVLREQMKIISEELGEDDDPISESAEYKSKLQSLKLSKDIYDKLYKECNRLAKMPPGSSETNLTCNYIETCLSLPWNKKTKDNIDLDKAQKILDKQHFGLKDIKDRIIEILAVKKLSKSVKGQIICFEGPPGVGKTSITKSLAEAMGRKYQRISLGGVKDEAEIRGHRRTYIGAMPGRIISAVKQSGVKNPLILLDEIDKLSSDYHGDPAAALLEVLDPEQNHAFFDHYIDLPFDLSEVLFITTANDSSQIPRPLYDRMEIITLYSYTQEEKFNIAKKHLISKLLKENSLKKKEFSIEDDALNLLIESYTKEAGVRGLEKKLSSLMRKAAKEIVSGKSESVNIDTKKLKKMLGPEIYKKHERYKNSEIGVVKGLAWTSAGGEILPIEVSLMKGKGKVQITGSLGDVMKESAQIAVSYIRSNAEILKIKSDFYNKHDIHIHAPEGAVPKDGPSAGVTMTTALVSALSGIPVKQDVAMTGEITLKGKVLAIGGLKEKTMAAYKDGVKTVIIPNENRSDLEKIDEKVKKSINFVMADSLDTVFEHSLDVNHNVRSHGKEDAL